MFILNKSSGYGSKLLTCNVFNRLAIWLDQLEIAEEKFSSMGDSTGRVRDSFRTNTFIAMHLLGIYWQVIYHIQGFAKINKLKKKHQMISIVINSNLRNIG